jgi:hypothetical protein
MSCVACSTTIIAQVCLRTCGETRLFCNPGQLAPPPWSVGSRRSMCWEWQCCGRGDLGHPLQAMEICSRGFGRRSARRVPQELLDRDGTREHPPVTAEDARKTVGSEGTGHLEQRIGSVAPAALFGQQALDLVRVEGGATPTARSIAQTAAGKPILQLRRIYLAVIPG